MASDWADIRHAREAEEKKAEEAKKAAEEKKKKADEKAAETKEMEGRKVERKRRIVAMLEDSEGVAMNIARAEKKLKTAADNKEAKGWMDVVMR